MAGLGQTPAAAAQDACPALSAQEVVQRLTQMNLERARLLPAYRSTRTYRASYRGFPGARTAEMVVGTEYLPPDTKRLVVLSQSGSKVIIDRVFKKLLEAETEAFAAANQERTALNEQNYRFTMVACEDSPQGPMYVLAVEPKVKSKLLYVGRIWVDPTDFAVTQIIAAPAKNPSFWIRKTEIRQVYSKVDTFWLPARNHSESSVRLGGKADLTIEYGEYRLAIPAAPKPSQAARHSPEQAPAPSGPKLPPDR